MRRRRAFLCLGAAAVAMVVVSAVPAVAQNPNNKVELVRGQGSDSSYDLMQRLDFIYNNSFGCQVIVGAGQTQNLDNNCVSTDQWAPTKSNENWDHDVALSFFAVGSSVGINILKGQGNAGVAKIDYARSSRAPRAGDGTGLRFVAYAKDATPWVNFRGQNPDDPAGQHTEAGTPAAGVDRLSVQQLKDIFVNRTAVTTDPDHTCVINNWDQIGGAAAEIMVWTSQRGSGERATFDTFLGASSSDVDTTEHCIPAQFKDGIFTNGERIIFENDATPIRTCGAVTNVDCSAGDDLRSIYHLGFGAYNASPVHPTRGKAQGADMGAICTAEPAAGQELCDVSAAIFPTFATIAAETGFYPFTRNIYNVYRSASMSNPVPNHAKRFIGEHGWICRLNTGTNPNGHINNPKTNVNYGSEIETAITAVGFVNIPVGQTGLGDTSDSKCRLSAPPS